MLKTVSKVIQLFFLLFLGAGAYHAYGQVYPVQVTTQIVPPYTPYLSDYTAPGSQRMMMNFVLRDPTLPEYRCKLRITIEGVGITIRTKASYVPEALVLPGGGVPTLLYGEDLLEYFKPDNLDFAGITRNQYEKGARLPEGIYRFTVEVLDYNRNTVVSNKGTATAWVILNDPPLLNLPRKDTKVQILDPTNIPFTWTPRHTGSPNAAFTTEYVFRLVEVWPITRNPYDAFLSQPVLYEVTSNVPQIIYDMAAPALLPGRKYAWQVQARDVEGRDLFKNDGRSEVYVFQFGDALGIPEALTLQSSTSSALTVRWDQPAAGTDAVTYRTRYRPHNNRKHDDWYEGTTNDQWKTLSSLQPNTEYEVQVRAEQTVQTSDYSATGVFKTAEAGASDFACKSDVQPPPTPASTTPTFPLKVNDTIHAGGYDVLVRGLTASGKTYTGDGFAMVPWLHGAKVRVTFKDIAVNSQFWLTSGEIKSVWNPDSKFLINVPSKDNPANTPNTGDLPVTVVATDSVVKIKDAAIATVTKDPDGNIVVSTTDGKTTVLEKGKSYSIVDDIGNGYVVDKEGNITKTTAEQALAAADRGNRDYNIAVQFEKPEHSKFGFDAKKYEPLNSFYQQLDGGDYIAWKAVTSEIDEVNAIITGELKLDKLKFDISGVPLKPGGTSGKTITLGVQGKAEGTVDELLVTYPSSKDSTKIEFVGKLNLVSYDKISYNVVIVPVNGAKLPGGVDEPFIQEKLNKVYGQAVVDWKVSAGRAITADIPANGFDDGEPGLLSNYTSDMRAVIKAYQGTTRFQDNTYYLFLIENPKSGKKALGYMPRNKQAGFIFSNNHTGEDIVYTIGHELGHGAFNLQHTFDEFAALGKGATDNLMDYPSGLKLNKYQWDHVHDPQRVFSLFEDSEESQSVIVQNIAELKPFINSDKRTYTFMTPAGVPYTLPADVTEVVFYANDESGDEAFGFYSTENFLFPDGALRGFTLADGTRYVAYLDGTDRTKFLGYSSSGKDMREDELSKTLSGEDTKSVIIGLLCVNKGAISYKVRAVQYSGKWVTTNHTGSGKYQESLPVSLFVAVSKNGVSEVNLSASNFEQTTPYTETAKRFLENVDNCEESYNRYILSIANLMSSNEELFSSCFLLDVMISKYVVNPSCTTCITKPSAAGAFQDYKKRYDELLAMVKNYKSQNSQLMAVKDAPAMRALLKSSAACMWDDLEAHVRLHVLQVLAQESMEDCGGKGFFGSINKSTFDLFNNCAEDYAIQILEHTPEAQYTDMLDGLLENNLLKTLSGKLNGNHFDKLFQIITDWMYATGRGYQDKDALFQDGKFLGYMATKIKNFGQYDNDRYYTFTGLSDDATQINFEFKWYNPDATGLQKELIQKKTIDMDGWVLVYFPKTFTIGTTSFKGGTLMEMPAAYLYWIQYRDAQGASILELRRMADMAALIMPLGQVGAGVSTLSTVIRVAEIALPAADLLIAGNEPEILKLQGGQEFLDDYNYLCEVYLGFAIVRMTPALYYKARNLVANSKFLDKATAPFRERATKLIDKLRPIVNDFATASNIANLLEISDDAVTLGKDLALAQEYIKRAPRQPGVVDVVVHGSGDTYSIIADGGVATLLDGEGLLGWIKKYGYGDRTIRLLSCSSLESAQGIADGLGQLGLTKGVIATEDIVRLYPDGGIQAANSKPWYKLMPNAKPVLAESPRPPASLEGLYVELGRNAPKIIVKTWEEAIQAVEDLLKPQIAKLKALYPDVKFGYRGSLATGRKYSTRGPFNPKDWDVDALIVSDQIAAKYNVDVIFRNARKLPAFNTAAEELEAAFKEISGYRVDPDKPFTFRVWTLEEFKALPGKKKLIQ